LFDEMQGVPVLLGLGRRKQALPGLETSMIGLESYWKAELEGSKLSTAVNQEIQSSW
jgi:hypothetical protein